MWLIGTTTCRSWQPTAWMCVCLTAPQPPTSQPSTWMKTPSEGLSDLNCWGMSKENGNWIPHMVENSYEAKYYAKGLNKKQPCHFGIISHRVHSWPGEGARCVCWPTHDWSEDLWHAGRVWRLQPQCDCVWLLCDTQLPKKPRHSHSSWFWCCRHSVCLTVFTPV